MSMKTVEFFSGIGGWSYSLANLSDKFEVIEAFDINPIANQVYKLNHGLVPNHKSIEHVTAKHLNSLQADMWVMSPPCQPHTRNNTTDTRDDNDPRSNAFIKLMTLLQEMTPPPRYIALEVSQASCCAVLCCAVLCCAVHLCSCWAYCRLTFLGIMPVL
jgi:tRNA (cytosine38-C5)-methyltransferase